MNSKLTDYEQYSAFSGAPAEVTHHLIFGRGLRQLADEDGLMIGLLNREHNMSPNGTKNQIHDNPAAEKLSKIAGQLGWERNYLIEKYGDFDELSHECREAFRKRYGQSFL